jgi:hypothetical protein
MRKGQADACPLLLVADAFCKARAGPSLSADGGVEKQVLRYAQDDNQKSKSNGNGNNNGKGNRKYKGGVLPLRDAQGQGDDRKENDGSG